MEETTRVSREAFRYAESLLYHHKEAKKELARLREELLSTKRHDENIGGGRSNLPGDPTGASVAKLYGHKRVRELDESTRIIDEIYEQLPEEKKKIVKLYYWAKPRTLTWEGVAMRIEKDGVKISSKTARRWRDDIILLIAERKGLV